MDNETTDDTPKSNNGCCGDEKIPCKCGTGDNLELSEKDAGQDGVCCGSSQDTSAGTHEHPGYSPKHFVEDFTDTQAGPIPRVRTTLVLTDFLGTVRARTGIGRNRYRIAPGLYCVGDPGPDSPVLVTANYKLSFDSLRRELDTLDAWILVLDTRGINVWCAAGKGILSTGEVARRVKLTGLERIVNHRELILPQLSATGVSAHLVKKECGFKVVWGPLRARDIKKFLEGGMKADRDSRLVTFSMKERLELIPVELYVLLRYAPWVILAIFLLSGVGSDIFSLSAAWSRGLIMSTGVFAGILGGMVAVPIFLPWIPTKSFSMKGAITGTITGAFVAALLWESTYGMEILSLFLCTVALSSYLGMNFTGATPFTSPSGVEKEMRKAIPLQTGTMLAAIIIWVGTAFFH
jgi:hypothetical protein